MGADIALYATLSHGIRLKIYRGQYIAFSRRRSLRHFENLLSRKDFMPGDLETKQNDQPFLTELYAAAVSGRVLSGLRAGQQTARVGDLENHGNGETSSPLCVNVNGVGLHANTVIPAHDRMRLERMCRYYGASANCN